MEIAFFITYFKYYIISFLKNTLFLKFSQALVLSMSSTFLCDASGLLEKFLY